MREIKFRAWDAKRERMMQPFLIFEKHPADGLVTETTNWHDENDMKEEWDTSNQVNELMQYTGLKDKNNIPIYEGDILKAIDVLLTVWYNDATASFDVLHYGDETGDTESLYEQIEAEIPLEIIGNIHQHPHLLNQ